MKRRKQGELGKITQKARESEWNQKGEKRNTEELENGFKNKKHKQNIRTIGIIKTEV